MEIYKPIYHWRAYFTGFGLIRKKELHARLSWTNTPVQDAKAPRKFGVLRSFRNESNRNRLFYKTVSGNFEIFIVYRFKVFFPGLFGSSLAERSKTAITFLSIRNFENPRHRFVKQTILRFDSYLNERKTPKLRDALASWTGVLVQERRAWNSFFFQLNHRYFNTDG